MTAPALREAARAVLLDDNDRIMLLRYDENGGFWATPGGSLEPGENHRRALIRELREELGIQDAEIGPQLAARTQDHLVAGRPVRHSERYYLARVLAGTVSPEQAHQSDNIRDWQCWTLAELSTTSQTVYPAGLADLIETLLSSCSPESPVLLS